MQFRSAAVALALLCAVAGTHAFQAPVLGLTARSSQMSSKSAISAPRMMLDETSSVLDMVSQTEAMGLSVTMGAYAATILGLFVPVVFLIILYVQTAANNEDSTFRDVGDVKDRYKNLMEFKEKRGMDPNQ